MKIPEAPGEPSNKESIALIAATTARLAGLPLGLP
jgi:hypothetical protein